MTVSEFISQNNLKIFADGLNGDTIITGAYSGDFLSNAMSRVPEGGVWFTVMNNVNVAAVASLSGCAAVVLCEGVAPDKSLLEAAVKKLITLTGADVDVFNASRHFKL